MLKSRRRGQLTYTGKALSMPTVILGAASNVASSVTFFPIANDDTRAFATDANLKEVSETLATKLVALPTIGRVVSAAPSAYFSKLS